MCVTLSAYVCMSTVLWQVPLQDRAGGCTERFDSRLFHNCGSESQRSRMSFLRRCSSIFDSAAGDNSHGDGDGHRCHQKCS